MWNKNYNKFNITNYEQSRLNIIKGDATQNNILNKIPNNLDIILDNGSHKLKNGGIYIIEDVHCVKERNKFIDYMISLFPFVYKFNNFNETYMLSGRETIKERIKLDWRYEIKDITFSRDIIIVTKENIY